MEETPNYMQMGIASLIPGMQHMVVLMEKELDKMRAMLAAAKEQADIEAPRKVDRRGSYWQDLTPEERSVEMKRRVAKSRRMQKKAAQGDAPRHPSDPRHPGHDRWIENLRASQRKVWATKTKAARKALVAKMQESKAAKRAERAAA